MDQASGSKSVGVENMLGESTRCEGVLTAEGNLRIDGAFEGRIETTGNVIVGPAAQIKGDIRARAAQIWGLVQGDLIIEKRLEILSQGRVWGDIEVGALAIDEGGFFEGQCIIAGEKVDPYARRGRQATEEPRQEEQDEPELDDENSKDE